MTDYTSLGVYGGLMSNKMTSHEAIYKRMLNDGIAIKYLTLAVIRRLNYSEGFAELINKGGVSSLCLRPGDSTPHGFSSLKQV